MKVGALSVLIDISLKVFRGSTIQNGLYSSPQKPSSLNPLNLNTKAKEINKIDK